MKKLFSGLVLELLVSTAVSKVVVETIRNNVTARNTLHKLLRFTGEVVIISVVTDVVIDHVDQRVAAMKAWWEKRKDARTTR